MLEKNYIVSNFPFTLNAPALFCKKWAILIAVKCGETEKLKTKVHHNYQDDILIKYINVCEMTKCENVQEL